MSAKKWLVSFILTVFGLLALLGGLNLAVDPFGIFGDRLFSWYSYDMTLNPRAAKIAYLDRNHEKYDSYIIGCSSTSSYPVEQLNEYYDASFYNMIMYGADMLDVEQESRYIIENYECKNLIVNVYIDNAMHYDEEENPLTYSVHSKAAEDGFLDRAEYYLRYLKAKPTYAVDKLRSWYKDTYLNQTFDVFNAETGAYDKTRRDAERISDRESYLKAYLEFANYPQTSPEMTEIESTAESLARIRDLCEEKGINFVVVSSPVYWEYFDDFSKEEVLEFYTALAEVTDFWDFSMSSVSYEMRYFYDATHFRNCVGQMALARMAGDDSVYLPEDFGRLVTKENVRDAVDSLYTCSALSEEENTADVPVLLYHEIDPAADGSNGAVLSPQTFENQIRTLAENGYTAISLKELTAYVEKGEALPEKPVVITFDDGYQSNYEYAYPILKKYGMKATIFVIGSSVGKDEYKDTGRPLLPHFGVSEAREMENSGLISIQSHTYDLHQNGECEKGIPRENMAPLSGEDEWDYADLIADDVQKERELIRSITGGETFALAYPGGQYTELTTSVLVQLGIKATFTTQPGRNVVVKGLPQSLLEMNRYIMYEETTADQLLKYVSSARG